MEASFSAQLGVERWLYNQPTFEVFAMELTVTGECMQ